MRAVSAQGIARRLGAISRVISTLVASSQMCYMIWIRLDEDCDHIFADLIRKKKAQGDHPSPWCDFIGSLWGGASNLPSNLLGPKSAGREMDVAR